MSRAGVLILLGILTILTPFSGLPIAIRALLAVISGAGVLGIGLSLRVREAQHMQASVGVSTPEPATMAEIPKHEPHGVSPI